MDEFDELLSRTAGLDPAGAADPATRIPVLFTAQVSAAYARASDLEEALRMIFEDEDPELMDLLLWQYSEETGVACYAPSQEIATRVGEVASLVAELGSSDNS